MFLSLFFHGSTALLGLCFLCEVPRSHSDTPHLVGLLWTNDQPRCRDLYLTTHSTHKRQTSMLPERFEHEIPESDLPQIHSSDRLPVALSLQNTRQLSYRNLREPWGRSGRHGKHFLYQDSIS
jgi:hypothetical protein